MAELLLVYWRLEVLRGAREEELWLLIRKGAHWQATKFIHKSGNSENNAHHEHLWFKICYLAPHVNCCLKLACHRNFTFLKRYSCCQSVTSNVTAGEAVNTSDLFSVFLGDHQLCVSVCRLWLISASWAELDVFSLTVTAAFSGAVASVNHKKQEGVSLLICTLWLEPNWNGLLFHLHM